MTLQDLARQARHVLDLQQAYFRSRTSEALRVSKDAEKRLRAACDEILSPKQSGLFDQKEASE